MGLLVTVLEIRSERSERNTTKDWWLSLYLYPAYKPLNSHENHYQFLQAEKQDFYSTLVQVGCCGEPAHSSDTLNTWGTTVTDFFIIF